MRSSWILVQLAFTSALLTAQSTPQQNYRADLNFVANQLPRLHANFFFHLSQADFNQAVSQLDSQISNLTDAEFYARLTGLVALAGDPHTTLYLNTAAGYRQFPLQFRWLDDGVFVTAAAPDYAQALGAQLVAVGDSGMATVEAKLASIIPHTNLQWVHQTGAQFLAVQQILQGLDLAPPTPSTPLTFRDRAGRQFTLAVSTGSAGLQAFPATDEGTIPLYLQNPQLNYWFTYSAPLRLLYFKYNHCAQMTSDPFADFAGRFLNALDSNPVDTIVFDYRGNGGGDSSIIQPLFDGLNQRLATLISNLNLRVYDVIDQGTFSSALTNAMAMKSAALTEAQQPPGMGLETRLVVIGAPTGGPTSGYGEVLNFNLPSGKMQGQYSTNYFPAPAEIPDGPAFAPDIAVPVISADYFARHDPVTAAILARWTGSPPPPSGSAIVVNGASFRVEQGLAPGAFAAAFGTFPAAPDQVLVNGQAAGLVAAATSQVDFVVPVAAVTGPAAISVRSGGQEIASAQVILTPASPALFVLQATDPTQPGAILNQDSQPNSQATPASAGSVLQIFATGNGAVDGSGSAPVSVIAGGMPADFLYSAPYPGVPGLWQINARLPAGLTGQVSLFLIAGNTASNGVTVWVQ